MNIRTKLVSLLLCVIMVLGTSPVQVFAAESSGLDIWDGRIATEFAGGSGTKTDSYLIATGAELSYLAELVNSSINMYNKFFSNFRHRFGKY